MYNCEKEFNKFYRHKVVLSEKNQNNLRDKRKKNIKRLRDGLEEYNKENNTEFKLSENRIQGSMAMHTIIQNEKKDYDIDVGVVFEKEQFIDFGPFKTRKIIAEALSKKTAQFSEDPEVKTSCVRLKYSSGYHIDFAIFRRYKENEDDDKYIYDHAGAEWTIRDLKGVEEWFADEIKEKGTNLRKVVRLCKKFCNSKSNMPSGLIQTILCAEEFDSSHDRIDEIFYYTMANILNRLKTDIIVNAPVDNNRPLVYRKKDEQRMESFKNQLQTNIDKLSVLFESYCTKNEAMNIWKDFFDDSYWSEFTDDSLECSSRKFDDTEQFIDDMYPINERYNLSIACEIETKGFMKKSLESYLTFIKSRCIKRDLSIKCYIKSTNCKSYDKILWKVRNVGIEAEKRNDIRGQISNRGEYIIENSKFNGEHYVECYLIKDGVCVAIGHIDIPIE